MNAHQNTHTEAAIYWSTVSLIVCEGLSIGAAADRLGIERARLRNILRRRHHRLASVTDSRHSRPPQRSVK